MRVNILVQCLATLILPTGLYAFKRIDKLKKGILVYGASFGLTILSVIVTGILFVNKDGQTNLVIALYSLGLTAMSFFVPIYYMRNWSIEFNKKIGKENITSSQAVQS